MNPEARICNDTDPSLWYGVTSTQKPRSLRDRERLLCKGSHHLRYDEEDGEGSEMEMFDMMGIQMTKCSFGSLTLGVSQVSGIDQVNRRNRQLRA